MPEKPPPRPLRADARRNRDALIRVAREAFSTGDVTVRIEEIARRAGVGVGTLYRHFATREAIIEAVYHKEIEALFDCGAELLNTLPADRALEAFFQKLVAHLAANIGLAKALESAMAGALPTTGDQVMFEAVELLLAKGAEEGSLRSDVHPSTLMATMRGLCLNPEQEGWEAQALAMVGLVMDGLRYGLPEPATDRP